MKSGIYYIKCLKNNKYYIGSAVNISYRITRHIKSLNNKKHHSVHLQRAWNKYGKDEFEFGVIEKFEYNDKILNLETFYIQKYRSSERRYGFNIYKDARSRLGFKHSDKTKKLISENSFSKDKFYEDAVKPSVKVYQYDIDGNFIKEWLCVKRASDELNITYQNIFKCIENKRKICGNFRWFGEFQGEKIESISKIIVQRDLNDVFIEEFNLIKDITLKYPEFNAQCIWSVCNKKFNQCYGFKWIYKKDIK